MNSLIEKITTLEWEQFQQVKDENGRASCQENWLEFHRFRTSQFLAWSPELLASYYEDCTQAIRDGRNLLTEKYARMMEHTAPESYFHIRDLLPPLTEKTKTLIAAIVRISINWAEEFSREYPVLSGNGRPIHTSEDGPYTTSIETYTRGELATYSDKTLRLYYDYVKQLQVQNRNLTKIIMEHTVHAYGYESLDQAENRMAKS